METPFEQLGFFKEYYLNGKFFGSLNIETPDRNTIGYNGRRDEILNETLTFNKGRIKAGTTVQTIIYPLCGRLKK